MISPIALVCIIGAAVAYEVPVVHRPYYLPHGVETGVYSHWDRFPLVKKDFLTPFYDTVKSPVFTKKYYEFPQEPVTFPYHLNSPVLAKKSYEFPQEPVTFPYHVVPYGYDRPYVKSVYPEYENVYGEELGRTKYPHFYKTFPFLTAQPEHTYQQVQNFQVPQALYGEHTDIVTPFLSTPYKKYFPTHSPVVFPRSTPYYHEEISTPYKVVTATDGITPVFPFGRFYGEGVTRVHDVTYKTPLVVKPTLPLV